MLRAFQNRGLYIVSNKRLVILGTLLAVAAGNLAIAPSAYAFNMGNMMNPGKWFDNNRYDDDDYYYDRYGPYGGPYGYGGGPYGGWGGPYGGYGPYGYGYPGYGYGAPGYQQQQSSEPPPPPLPQ